MYDPAALKVADIRFVLGKMLNLGPASPTVGFFGAGLDEVPVWCDGDGQYISADFFCLGV